MRFYSRNDPILIAGLTAAAVVVFARPVSDLLNRAHQIEMERGLGLLPGLIILTVVLLLHQQGRRQDLKAQTAAAAAEAREAQARASELERLVAFGQALARALDLRAIRDVVVQRLPELAGRSDGWVVVMSGGHWVTLVSRTGLDQDRTDIEHEKLAEQFFGAGVKCDRREGSQWGEDVCFPLIAGRAAVGVLGVPVDPALSDHQRRLIAASMAVLAIAVKNADLFREVRENGLRDGLTGCYNRTHGLEVLDVELRRARRSNRPLSVIMADLDHFKQVNDGSGHQAGDAVLADVGRRMCELLRSSDVKCRYGGEEFLIVLPDTPLEGARRVAETLRRGMGELKIEWNARRIGITSSFGIAEAYAGETDVLALIARADAALYRAKNEGRNRVAVASDVPVAPRGVPNRAQQV